MNADWLHRATWCNGRHEAATENALDLSLSGWMTELSDFKSQQSTCNFNLKQTFAFKHPLIFWGKHKFVIIMGICSCLNWAVLNPNQVASFFSHSDRILIKKSPDQYIQFYQILQLRRKSGSLMISLVMCRFLTRRRQWRRAAAAASRRRTRGGRQEEVRSSRWSPARPQNYD